MRKTLLLVLWLTAAVSWAANSIHTPRVKSLTSIVNGDWLSRPVMTLGSDDVLVVGLDELSHDVHRLVYHLEHCEADWTPSEELFESDWLQGFNDNPIDDYQHSINTTVLYTHYQMQIPNDRVRLTMSGNYRLTIYDEDRDMERLADVEFYVVEPLMNVSLSATTNTDIDHNVSHQQVSMALNYGQQRITNLEEQLYTVVLQNWREDRAVRNPLPNHISASGLLWEHNRSLIFDAGNEYHKFEVLDVSHATMGLDRIVWDGTYYQAYPFPATVCRNYLTDEDADGAFCIRNSNWTETDYTCDYVWVNYELQAPWQGDLYISGQWTTDSDREHYLMRYDGHRQTYYTALLQKQGYYNYQYLTADGQTAPCEGSFFQTENRYQALVYYKETGGRTWRLVGYSALLLR